MSAEFAHALAAGQACREAISIISERYVIDEVARAKLIGLVVKIARHRGRSGQHLPDRSDTEAIALLAVERFLRLKSGIAK